ITQIGFRRLLVVFARFRNKWHKLRQPKNLKSKHTKRKNSTPNQVVIIRGPPHRSSNSRLLATGQLPINLAHDDIERADDGGDVGDEAAAAELVGDGEVAEGAAAGADAPGDRAAVADDIEAHLPAGAFGFEIRL